MEHIITSGCSYSDANMGAWPCYINDYFPDVKVHKYGACARGNDYISRTIISSVQKLLNDGVESNDIFVLSCWSGMQRHDILINSESVDMHYKLKSSRRDIYYSDDNPIGEWINFSDEWWKVIPDEQSYIISMEHILRTQWFLEKHDIGYCFFTFVNTLAYHNYSEFWKDNHYDKDKTKIIYDVYPTLKYLWDMIDWDKWWFSDENYGGLGNWIEENVPDGYSEDERDGILGHNHPTKEAHKKFTEKVISNFISTCVYEDGKK
jgi:hypothetical protein